MTVVEPKRNTHTEGCMMAGSALEEPGTGLVGDGYDIEPLLDAHGVASILHVPYKTVYDLPIKRLRLSNRRIRYRPADLRAYIDSREEG
jgi:hypothetical protein